MTSAPLNIVLTNDDGFNAPGIQTLYTALVGAGFNVHIVAPQVNQSAQGSSLGGTAALSNPIDITEFSPGNFFVDGKPATATLTALDDLFAGQAPDLVISGTNRGDNIGESENISGTVNAALQGLFEGVPSIAISAGSFNGSFDAAFANAGAFMVNFLQELQAAHAPGQPLLPPGEGLTINVPGNPTLAGVAVTTITPESTAAFPYAPNGTPNTFAEGFVPNTSPSGSPTAEGSQFLTNHITISPVDGNWGATEDTRDALAVRLGSAMTPTAGAPGPLNILLIDEDGFGSPGIVATRDSLLAAGYNVTVLAPATDQSGTGSALFLSPITVTQFDAHTFSASNGTPASLVALALDPHGLFNGAKPDLIVVGADQGDAVGIENANHSATLGGAITALFNYDVPSIALTSSSGSAASLATSSRFLTTLIENLQVTQGASASLLPQGVGLSINVPVGASAGNYAFTNIDAATDANLSVLGNDNFAHYSSGAPVTSPDPHSEGNAFNAGKITVSPIDGSIAVRGSGAYDFLASLIGTTFGDPTSAPAIAGDLAIALDEGGTVALTTADLTAVDPDTGAAALIYTVTATSHGEVLVDGRAAQSFTQLELAAGDVSFHQDGSETTTAAFSVSLGDGSGLAALATVNAAVTPTDEPAQGKTIKGTNGNDSLTGTPGNDTIRGRDGADLIDAGDGNDRVFGGKGKDTLLGGRGDDRLNGGDGSDLIDGGAGNDRLTGGDGPDTFAFHAGFGHDLVADFSHNDVISFDHQLFGNFQAVMAAMHRDGHDTVITLDASNSVTLENVLPAQLHSQNFSFT